MARATQVKDPVCGMSVRADSTSEHVTYDGETYYFCSPGCRRQFEADPDRYVRAAARGGERVVRGRVAHEPGRGEEPPFTRSGPIAAPKFGSAGSGGAEYEPGPEKPRKGGDR